jgi:hypothetical protein
MTPERIAAILADEPAGTILVHASPAIDETCKHDWRDGPDGNPEQCTKCGLSFTRYIFCCMP